jgi:hypothetical protein
MLEYRADSASNYEFATSDSLNTGDLTKQSQVNSTVTYAAVYGF